MSGVHLGLSSAWAAAGRAPGHQRATETAGPRPAQPRPASRRTTARRGRCHRPAATGPQAPAPRSCLGTGRRRRRTPGLDRIRRRPTRRDEPAARPWLRSQNAHRGRTGVAGATTATPFPMEPDPRRLVETGAVAVPTPLVRPWRPGVLHDHGRRSMNQLTHRTPAAATDLSPTQGWLATTSHMPALTGPAGTAERLLLLIHYGIDWQEGWVGPLCPRSRCRQRPSPQVPGTKIITNRAVDSRAAWWSESLRQRSRRLTSRRTSGSRRSPSGRVRRSGRDRHARRRGWSPHAGAVPGGRDRPRSRIRAPPRRGGYAGCRRG